MKIIRHGEPIVIMSNPESIHNYFGWPTVARLQNGKIAVAASGFRLAHVCPFGKTVLSLSEDEGQTYTPPTPIIDTSLDDRDGGIVPFGESGVIVTSFNNTRSFQRNYWRGVSAYSLAHLDTVTDEEEARDLGVTFRLSHDCGKTFGPLMKSPVTSHHGPISLPDGGLLWVGRTFSPNCTIGEVDRIEAHRVHPDGHMEFVGAIGDAILDGQLLLSCEPHGIVLKDGTILVHIRAEQRTKEEEKAFTIFQTVSHDGGKSWETPYPILSRMGGAPSHLFRHSSGILIATYGYRGKPSGIKAMFSRDEGKTWDTGHDLYVNGISPDLGYPSTVECSDGSLITVFYAHPSKEEPAVILQQRWKIEEE